VIRKPRGAVIAVVACVVIVSCGVPKQSTATRIRAKHVPFGLLDRNAGAAASETAGDAASVYFATSGRLVAVARRLASSAPPQDLLNLLRRGPTKGEVEAGLRSAVPNQNLARVSSVTAGTATVDLRSEFSLLPSADQFLALAQLVFTLTSRPGIGQVRFTLGGRATDVPLADGSLVRRRVSRDDYEGVAPAT
jgi:spore germination protein GerM